MTQYRALVFVTNHAVLRRGRAAVVIVLAAVVIAAAVLGFVWWKRQNPAGTTNPPAAESTDVAEASGTPWFREVAADAGINFEYVRATEIRFWFPEIMGGGGAMFDYDNDGDMDVYLVQGGELDKQRENPHSNRLFRNDGNGRFTDVTGAAGVGDRGYGMGCACADFDNDGNIDLYVTNVGPNVLYRNNGDGTFADVTSKARTGHPGWSTSAAFLDYDRDGHLDLFVTNYITWSPATELECVAGSGQRDYCKPNNYTAPAVDTLYHNNGDGTFSDVTEASGISRAFGNGLGVAIGDFNLDGRPDIYVANDGLPNQLWTQTENGRFVDEALLAGCALNMEGHAEAGMGVSAVDIEHDGDLDLFMTHLRDESNTFYINGGGMFDDFTPSTGLAAPSIGFTGFGMGFADFNNDALLDLYIANGRVGWAEMAPGADDPYAESNQLFRGKGDGRFVELQPRGGTVRPLVSTSRAAVFGDYDNDGGVDVLVVNNKGRAHLLHNEAPDRRHHAMFRVLATDGGIALGAMVKVTAGGRSQWRHVQSAYSYCASNDPRVHVGLGDAERVDEVLVRWPDGSETKHGPFEADRLHVIRRPATSVSASP